MKRCNFDIEKVLNEMLEMEEKEIIMTRSSSSDSSARIQNEEYATVEDLLFGLDDEVQIDKDEF